MPGDKTIAPFPTKLYQPKAGRGQGTGLSRDLSEGGFRSDIGPAMNNSLGAEASIVGRHL
jgi:hypothetical protein